MSSAFLMIGVILAVMIASSAFRVPNKSARGGIILLALIVLMIGVAMSSVRYVGANSVGVVKRNALGPPMTPGMILATNDQMGPPADVLAPGWHLWYWPVLFDVDVKPLVDIPADKIGLVESRDGLPLDPGQVFAPEVTNAEFKKMVEDPKFFLTAGNGRKGPQSNVLTPGKYRLNPELFTVTMVETTEVPDRKSVV